MVPQIVHDLSALKPFDATNRTAVLILKRGGAPEKSIPYTIWKPAEGFGADVQDISMEDISRVVRLEVCSAAPVDPMNPSSPWRVISPSDEQHPLRSGSAQYKGRSGIHTHGANAIFWLEKVKSIRAGVSLYRNVNERAKKKVEEKIVPLEEDLVFRLLRGRDTRRWKATPQLHILLTHSEETNKNPISISEMRRRYPAALGYVESFKAELEERSMMKELGESGPYYRLFKIGPYTFARAKVVWREQSSELSAAVVTTSENKVVVADHKLYLIPCDSEKEAHYICAILNSRAAVQMAKQTALPTSQATHILDFLPIPKYDGGDDIHLRLSKMSELCHKLVEKDDVGLAKSEREIDEVVEKLWSSKVR